MTTSNTTRPSTRTSRVFGGLSSVPGVLLAYSSPGAATVDRCIVSDPFVVGRSSDCDFPLSDGKVSKHHLRISKEGSVHVIEDLGSTNGTFVDGRRLEGKMVCADRAIIRAGREVVVFHADAGPMLDSPPPNRYGLVGPFHAAPLIQDLLELAHSHRHILLAGPSGAGKELAAHALAEMLGAAGSPLSVLAHNAARFTSEDEAASTLFGVGPRVFSDVDARAGLIEQASGGILFLDEVHNLPIRVQRSLLRTIEDKQFSRIGESKTRSADVRFVLASNAPPPEFGVARDLLARLRVLMIPPLNRRVADIPAIFLSSLRASFDLAGLDVAPVLDLIGGDHFEAMCLDGFEVENVRGIQDLSDRLVTKIKVGVSPKDAVADIFTERFGSGLVARRYSKAPIPADLPPDSTSWSDETGSLDDNNSHYESHRREITAAFRQCNGNLSATERLLRGQGIRCSRRWIGVFAAKWGLR